MLCPACNHDNPQHVYYCQNCGQLLPSKMWEPVTRIDPVSPPLPVYLPTAGSTQLPVQHNYGLHFYAVCVIGLIFFLISLVPSKTSTTASPDAGTSMNLATDDGAKEFRRRWIDAEEDTNARALPLSEYPVLDTKPEMRRIVEIDTSEDGYFVYALSKDGNSLVGITAEKRIGLWDTRNGKNLRFFEEATPQKAEAFGSSQLTAANRNNSSTSANRFVSKMEISPDGTVLACSGSEDTRIGLWDTRTGKFRGYLSERISHPSDMRFTSDSRFLIIGGLRDANGNLINGIWDVPTRELAKTQTFLYERDTSDPIVYSPDGRYYAVNNREGTIKVWNKRTNTVRWEAKKPGTYLHAIKFSPDASRLLVTGNNALIEWDATNSANYRTLIESPYPIMTADYSPDGEWVVIVEANSQPKLCHLPSNRLLTLPLDGFRRMDDPIRFTNDGTRLQSVQGDGRLATWYFKKPLLPSTLKTDFKPIMEQNNSVGHAQ